MDAKFAGEILLHLPVVRETMPPFAGDAHDRAALAAIWLAGAGNTLRRKRQRNRAAGVRDPLRHVSQRRRPEASARLEGTDPEAIAGMLGTLSDINPDMPSFTGTDAEGHALAVYLSNPSQ